MALVIRMRQQGSSNHQHFRVVVTDRRAPRDGKYIEKLGWYNPFGEGEKKTCIDEKRLQYWIEQGAVVSEPVQALAKMAAPEVMKQLVAKRVAKRAKKRAKIREKKKASK